MENRNIFRKLVRNALITVLLLLVPFLAMQFTDEVDWTLGDFIVMGVLLFGTGLIYELATWKVHTRKQRMAIGFVLLIGFLYIWAELAVGIFTNWGS